MPLDGVCSLCKNPKATAEPKGGSAIVTCPQCGTYSITNEAMLLKDSIKVPRHLLSGVVRNYWEATREPFSVRCDFLASIVSFRRLSPNAIPRGTDIPAKADLVLRHICRKSRHPGMVIRVSGLSDYVIGFCQNYEELHFCIRFLERQGLIESLTNENSADLCCSVSAAGWAYLSGIGAEVKDQGFIAMSFKPELKPVSDSGIYPGIENAGYKPLRIDSKDHNNRIDDEIVAEIRKSKFVVADLTGKNAGAYFEAGFAMGLGKPVIWTCSQADMDKKDGVHFDTRQYSIVPWDPDNLADFAKRLTQRIEATIGHGRYVAEVIKPDKE